MPRYATEDREDIRRRGAEAFTRAQAGEERQQMNADRDARDFAFKEAQSAAVAQQRAHALTLQEERVSMRRQQLDLQEENRIRDDRLRADEAEFNQRLREREDERKAAIHPLSLAAKASQFERDTEQTATKEKLSIAADAYSTIVARAMPYVTPEQLYDVKRAAADANPAAAHHPATMDDIKDARAFITARTADERKKAAVEAKNEVPPALKLEAQRIDREYFSAVSAWNAFKKDNPDKAGPNEPQIEELRKKRDEIGAQIHGIENQPAPAANAATGAAPRPIFKDKNGNRAYKNPDGTFEPL